MGIEISLQTCFALHDPGSEKMILPEGINTVGDLLRHMGRQANFTFLDQETGEPEEDLEIILNGKEVWFYPSALDTVLKDGDRVEIYLLPLGGG